MDITWISFYYILFFKPLVYFYYVNISNLLYLLSLLCKWRFKRYCLIFWMTYIYDEMIRWSFFNMDYIGILYFLWWIIVFNFWRYLIALFFIHCIEPYYVLFLLYLYLLKYKISFYLFSLKNFLFASFCILLLLLFIYLLYLLKKNIYNIFFSLFDYDRKNFKENKIMFNNWFYDDIYFSFSIKRYVKNIFKESFLRLVLRFISSIFGISFVLFFCRCIVYVILYIIKYILFCMFFFSNSNIFLNKKIFTYLDYLINFDKIIIFNYILKVINYILDSLNNYRIYLLTKLGNWAIRKTKNLNYFLIIWAPRYIPLYAGRVRLFFRNRYIVILQRSRSNYIRFRAYKNIRIWFKVFKGGWVILKFSFRYIYLHYFVNNFILLLKIKILDLKKMVVWIRWDLYFSIHNFFITFKFNINLLLIKINLLWIKFVFPILIFFNMCLNFLFEGIVFLFKPISFLIYSLWINSNYFFYFSYDLVYMWFCKLLFHHRNLNDHYAGVYYSISNNSLYTISFFEFIFKFIYKFVVIQNIYVFFCMAFGEFFEFLLKVICEITLYLLFNGKYFSYYQPI